MNKDQTSKHDCLKLIVYEAEQHSTTVAQIPVFETGIKDIKAVCIEVDTLKPLQESDLTGVTDQKNQVQDDLIGLLADLSGVLQVYASDQKNQVLLGKIKFSQNKLEDLKKTDLISTASIIIAEAETIPADQLAAYGFIAEDLSQVKKLLQTFNSEALSPRKVIIERSNHTVNIDRLIDKAWAIKREKLDKLISQFKRKDPDFYVKYKAASHVSYQRSKKNGTNGDDESGEKKES